MKIAVVAPSAIPSRRANSIQTMKMAQAMASLGHTICVAAPGDPQQKIAWEDLACHYGLVSNDPQAGSNSSSFIVEWLPTSPNLRRYDFGLRSVRWARQWQADLLYTRLPQAAAIASQMDLPTILEIHDLPQGKMGKWLFRLFLTGKSKRRLVMITQALANDLQQYLAAVKTGFPQHFLIVAPDGVDMRRYANLPSPSEARKRLAIEIPERFTVGYSGHFYAGRGLDVMLQLAGRLPKVNFLLAGGEQTEVERLAQRVHSLVLNNVFISGFISNRDLPLYQAACEALLMPYQKQVAASSGGDIARYLSPMKVFEYLACGRVILSSDLPVLREVLSSQNAILLPSDNLDAWEKAILNLQDNPAQFQHLAEQARCDAQNYSWESRAGRILAGITGSG